MEQTTTPQVESDLFIVEPGSLWAQSYHPTRADAEQRLAQLMAEDSERWSRAEIVPADSFMARRESEYLADNKIEEITEQQFHDALNVLPPLAWKYDAGVERFNMMEFLFAGITRQYARLGSRYFTTNVKHGNRETYMTAEKIRAAFPDAL